MWHLGVITTSHTPRRSPKGGREDVQYPHSPPPQNNRSNYVHRRLTQPPAPPFAKKCKATPWPSPLLQCWRVPGTLHVPTGIISDLAHGHCLWITTLDTSSRIIDHPPNKGDLSDTGHFCHHRLVHPSLPHPGRQLWVAPPAARTQGATPSHERQMLFSPP